MRSNRFTAITMVLLASCAAWLRADVRLPAIIGSNMAIQQDAQAKIWGWADPGEEVTVTVGQTALPKVAPNEKGKWMVSLPAQKAGPVADITIAGKNSITLSNIVAGEVWLCSGQSNMQFATRQALNAEQEIAAANFPMVRLFLVKNATAATPQDDCQGQWVECSPQTVGNFPAVGYFFGRELYKALNVPVGLIGSSWGGTAAESWTSAQTLQSDSDFAPIVERSAKYPEEFPKMLAAYEENQAKWVAATQQAQAEGKPSTQPAPRRPVDPDKYPHMSGVLYNAMIVPLAPYNIRGAIWYQGESNAGRAYQYRKLLPAMIADWRKLWDNNDMAFGIVQLANFMKRDAEPVDSAWAELREAQTMTAVNVPHCGQALAIDIGDEKDIHPKNKQEVGRRLALWALNRTYGKDVVWSGPVYDSMKVEGDAIRVTFKSVGGGLTSKEGQPVKGFAIAGADKKFVWADATIDGESVVVKSPQVSSPVAIRYAWANNPDCNLYNKEGLPAAPFRTDDWPGVTATAK